MEEDLFAVNPNQFNEEGDLGFTPHQPAEYYPNLENPLPGYYDVPTF